VILIYEVEWTASSSQYRYIPGSFSHSVKNS